MILMSLDKERGRHLLSSFSVVQKGLNQVDLAELDRLYWPDSFGRRGHSGCES